MKISTSQVLALGGLCALFLGAGNSAFAQGEGHQDRNYGQDQSRQGDQNDRHYGQGQDNQDWRHGQSRYHHDQHDSAHNDYGEGQDGRGRYRETSQYRHANGSERRRLDRLHAAYAHAAAHGNYGAAERDHQHAQAIRASLHDRHEEDRQDRSGGF